MNLSVVAAVLLTALAAGGVAYVFLYPMLSGEKRAAKRQKALIGQGPVRRQIAGVTRRDQVAQSLKDLEEREKTRHKVTLEARIGQAGLAISRTRFVVLSAVSGLGLAILLFLTTTSPIMAGLGLLIGGLGLPRWVLGYLKKRRIKRFLRELPNALDIVVRGIRSGLPLGDCVRMIAREAAEPVKTEFRLLVEQQTIGIAFSDAVNKLYERVPVPESNFFAIVIGIQSRSGGNLSEAIGNLSRVLRERKKMRDKINAMSQEAKASAGIIAALPFAVAIMTYLTSPAYIELLWITTVGKIMLVVAAFWMTTGCLVMKKMINFDF